MAERLTLLPAERDKAARPRCLILSERGVSAFLARGPVAAVPGVARHLGSKSALPVHAIARMSDLERPDCTRGRDGIFCPRCRMFLMRSLVRPDCTFVPTARKPRPFVPFLCQRPENPVPLFRSLCPAREILRRSFQETFRKVPSSGALFFKVAFR